MPLGVLVGGPFVFFSCVHMGWSCSFLLHSYRVVLLILLRSYGVIWVIFLVPLVLYRWYNTNTSENNFFIFFTYYFLESSEYKRIEANRSEYERIEANIIEIWGFIFIFIQFAYILLSYFYLFL